MKIVSMTTVPLRFPYLCEIGAPFSTKEQFGALAVLLQSDEGPVGEYLIGAVNGKRLAVLDAMVRSLEPLVIGADPGLSGAFLEAALLDTRHMGPSGVSLIAIGAIDGALLDLRAKAAGLPVHRLIGAVREKVPAYYSGGLWIQVGLDDLQKTAQRIIERGYAGMKLRIGPGVLDDQLARVRAIREAIGMGPNLMVDVNQRLNERQSMQLGRALEPFDITWFEEPVPAEDHAAEARIAAALAVPIASGESAFSYGEFAHMIAQGCADVLMPDLQRVGGPTHFLRIAELAAAHGIPVSGHTAPEMSLALMATLRNGNFLEVMPWASPAYREKIEIVDGCAIASNRPGWGYALDPEALKRYAAN